MGPLLTVPYILKSPAKKFYLISQFKHANVPPQDILTIFVSVIRPKLEYASPVWHNSLTEEDSNLIESSQKRALKLVYPHLSYDEALDQTNLPSLKDRCRLLCEK